jgi:hypothetical protein
MGNFEWYKNTGGRENILGRGKSTRGLRKLVKRGHVLEPWNGLDVGEGQCMGVR